MANSQRVSLQDVAVRAGVSRVTASNVMRGKTGEVSPATRERVLAVMRELNYAPVPPPSRQNTHIPTRIIGVLFDYIEFEDTLGSLVLSGMKEAARDAGYDLLLLLRPTTEWTLEGDGLRFLDRRSDGLVIVVPNNRKPVLELMVRHQIPVVTCGLDSGLKEVPSVTVDNKGALQQATEYLIGQGHRAIAYLEEESSFSNLQARRRGYGSAMKKAGLKPRVITAKALHDSLWREQMSTLLTAREATAVACAGDYYALALWDLAASMGLKVPRDLSITGMDDLPESERRGLTTMRSDSKEMGRLALRSAVALIAGGAPPVATLELPVELIERTSVSNIPKHIVP